MKQWIAGLALLGLAAVIGCRHQCFLSEKDFKSSPLPPKLAEDLENDPNFGLDPLSGPTAAPADVLQPERPPRYLTLQEAIARSLENGTTSSNSPGLGRSDERLVSFTPGAGPGTIIATSDSIRVLALAPALQAAFMEQSAARFDPQWVSSVNWATTDNFQQGLQSFQNGTRAGFFSGLIKPTGWGGYLSTFFQADYSMLTTPPQGAFGVLNPTYTTRIIFGFEQPLLQGAGTYVNQILNRVNPFSGAGVPPGAAAAFNTRSQVVNQTPQFQGVGTEGILITRLRFNASRAEFERNVNAMVVNVEVAYWNLYEAYGELYTFEEVLRIAHKAWMMGHAKFEADALNPANYYPIRGQYEEFRGERVKALGKVLDAERVLRGLMGLPVEDGERLVPVTPPTLAQYRPDWNICVQDALNLRPELVIAREFIRGAQYNLDAQKNFLKPDLRLVGSYTPLGFGTRLDSNGVILDGQGIPRPENALQSLRSNHFDDWTLGLTLSIPLGYRLEHAAIRSGRIGLAQAYFALKDQEDKAVRALTEQYQKLSEWYARIESARNERRAYAESVRVRFREFAAGVGGAKTTPVDLLLEAQRRLALAQQKEYLAIAEYNNSLARLEFTRGTLLQHNSIVISEGSLPYCAEVRAVEHEQERAKALVIREKPLPLTRPGQLSCIDDLPDHLPTPAKIGDLPPDPDFEPAPFLELKELNPALNPSEDKTPLPVRPKTGKTPPKTPSFPTTEPGKTPLPFDLKLEGEAPTFKASGKPPVKDGPAPILTLPKKDGLPRDLPIIPLPPVDKPLPAILPSPPSESARPVPIVVPSLPEAKKPSPTIVPPGDGLKPLPIALPPLPTTSTLPPAFVPPPLPELKKTPASLPASPEMIKPFPKIAPPGAKSGPVPDFPLVLPPPPSLPPLTAPPAKTPTAPPSFLVLPESSALPPIDPILQVTLPVTRPPAPMPRPESALPPAPILPPI